MSMLSILSKIFVFNTLATILLITGHYIFVSEEVLLDEQDIYNILDSNASEHDKYLVLVSTMDGYVSALNGKTGQLQWTLSTGSGSLLSSSISETPMMRHGRETRLVPSLDGSLFQMDEEGVEPIPISADALLSSTLKAFDSSSIVGGLTTEAYAIDLTNGKVKYVCTIDGCELVDAITNESTLDSRLDDVLLIRRNDRTVRLIDMLSGIERWNFSVGQHDLAYVSSSEVAKSIKQIISTAKAKKNEVNHSQRLFKNDPYLRTDKNIDEEMEATDMSILVHVSSGLIRGASKSRPTHQYWNHQFDSAVAAVWQLRGSQLNEVDLFDDVNIIEPEHAPHQPLGSRSLYIGRYNDQPYIQPSPHMKKELNAALNEMSKTKDAVAMPRLRWRPYLYNAISRTPTIENCVNCEQTALMSSMNQQYPFDGGSYLRKEKFPVRQNSFVYYDNLNYFFQLFDSKLTYWKEITGVILLCLITQIVLSQFNVFSSRNIPTSLPSQIIDMPSFTQQLEMPPDTTIPALVEKEIFNSRYQTDFIHLECLGKGGFGVVFKARNKLDDFEYAVKRIALYDSETARGRVMREVKALAKLDHPGIVRYYQSWFESPPLGWQEKLDSFYIDMSSAPTETTSNALSSAIISSHIHHTQSVNDAGLKKYDNKQIFKKSMSVESQICDDYDPNCSENVLFELSSLSNDKNGDIDDSVVFVEDSKVSDKSWSFVSEEDGNGDIKRVAQHSSIIESNNNLNSKKHRKRALDKKNVKGQPRLKCAKSYLYIQMQLCKSESLKDWLLNRNKEGVQTEGDIGDSPDANKNQVLNIFHQIVSAISYVHSQSLMHRDLKPSNIFFAMDGLVKIGDFGLVTAVEDSYQEQSHKSRTSNSQHTKQVGTMLYMSPEQSAGKVYTYKVDIYALGVIFFEMLNSFSTEMERVQSLQNLRQHKYPQFFQQLHTDEFELLEPLLSATPNNRPDTADILSAPLLRPFEEPVTAYHRIHSRVRSTSSSKSLNDASPPLQLSLSRKISLQNDEDFLINSEAALKLKASTPPSN